MIASSERSLVALTLLLVSLPLVLNACGKATGDPNAKKMIVLGIDGLDPTLLADFMERGELPNFRRLRDMGDFRKLTTSMPPQSPVAWSNFITGMNPGGHGIFDFVHRDVTHDPPTPKFSASEILPPSADLEIGDYYLPLWGGGEINCRNGRAFWEILGDHDIPASVYKIPVNYPPSASLGETFSGMGTPDLLGSQGTSYFFTDNPPEDTNASGVNIVNVLVEDDKVVTALEGMPDPLLTPDAQANAPSVRAPFTVYLDPDNGTAKIEIGSEEVVLGVGEWSGWTPVNFDILRMFGWESVPIIGVTGVCRFYLKEISPDFKLYVSPINIDPSVPGSLSEPADAAVELYEALGDYYYTQNMPEDFQALGAEVISPDDFIQQSNIVVEERMKMFDYALDKFSSGLVFFYVGSVDLNCHMFFRARDEKHPAYRDELGEKFGERFLDLYREADAFLGKALAKVDDETTLIVMSDHGFAPFYRQFQLANWLRDEGYLAVTKNESADANAPASYSIDWSKTRAYSMGINGLYLNLQGREQCGIVKPGPEADQLKAEISQKLLSYRDEDPRFQGTQVVHHMYDGARFYSGEKLAEAPDLIVGYNRGYRSADDAGLCTVTDDPVLFDRDEWWSGDHCMSHTLVPGTLMSNRKIGKTDPALFDLAPTILDYYGIAKPDTMVGSSVF